MWICFPNAFLSIVHKDCSPNCLMVRARRRGDIERVFPRAKVRESLTTDYPFRAVVPRNVVANAVAKHILSLGYDNFKNSVRDERLHDAYSSVWGVMLRIQERSALAPMPPSHSWVKRRRPVRRERELFPTQLDFDADDITDPFYVGRCS